MANDKKKDQEYPMDWFFNPESSAVEALDNIGVNTGAVGALNLIDEGEGTLPPAYQRSFGFDEQMGRGMDYIAGATVDVSQETIDKIIPGIAIGAGEAISRIVKWDWKLPPAVRPKIKGAGKVGVAYTLALDASQLVSEKAREYGVRKTPSLLGAGTAAYGTYKLATKFAFNFLSNTKVGMAAEVMDKVIGDASLKVYNNVLKGVGAASNEQLAIKAQMLAREAGEQASKEVADVIKERMGKEAAKGWDDVTRQLIKPRVATKVGKYLVQFAPKLGKRLALSAMATAIPEPYSTALGVAGIVYTAYDIFNLMKHMPDSSVLYNLIFEDVPEENIEDTLMNEMTVADSLFAPGEQRMQE
jgi:hypothetical protein